MVIVDFGIGFWLPFGELPESLKNLDRSKVTLITHFDLTDSEIFLEVLDHNKEFCKKTNGLFSLFNGLS